MNLLDHYLISFHQRLMDLVLWVFRQVKRIFFERKERFNSRIAREHYTQPGNNPHEERFTLKKEPLFFSKMR